VEEQVVATVAGDKPEIFVSQLFDSSLHVFECRIKLIK
jgi:hypothetical protein